MKIIAISDTHTMHDKITISECDVLIHAGDATGFGREYEIRDFANWFNRQPATYKIFVPGNHEKAFEQQLPASKLWFQEECPTGIILINESITIPGLINIYGSPVTPWFHNWAWNASNDELKLAWSAIPTGIDILVTHGPAYGILDQISEYDTQWLGCHVLRDEIQTRIKPKIHICGHIHGSGGQNIKVLDTHHYNVSICDESYQPNNKPTEIIVD